MKNLSNVKYFVFSSGKTGSKTLVHALSRKFGYDKVIHVHSAQHFKNGHPRYGDVKELMIENAKKFDQIYVIDSYREPFERGIASFFQNINDHCPNWKLMSVNQIIDFFNENKLYLLDIYHSYHESWGYFDISTDVDFNFEEGYIIREYENIIFIKTRLKEVHRWESIFSKIMGSKIIFKHENNSEGKFYAEKYKKFKEKYKLPEKTKEEFLNAYNNKNDSLNRSTPFYLSCSEMKKFMTKEEIDNYLKKWVY